MKCKILDFPPLKLFCIFSVGILCSEVDYQLVLLSPSDQKSPQLLVLKFNKNISFLLFEVPIMKVFLGNNWNFQHSKLLLNVVHLILQCKIQIQYLPMNTQPLCVWKVWYRFCLQITLFYQNSIKTSMEEILKNQYSFIFLPSCSLQWWQYSLTSWEEANNNLLLQLLTHFVLRHFLELFLPFVYSHWCKLQFSLSQGHLPFL